MDLKRSKIFLAIVILISFIGIHVLVKTFAYRSETYGTDVEIKYSGKSQNTVDHRRDYSFTKDTLKGTCIILYFIFKYPI